MSGCARVANEESDGTLCAMDSSRQGMNRVEDSVQNAADKAEEVKENCFASGTKETKKRKGCAARIRAKLPSTGTVLTCACLMTVCGLAGAALGAGIGAGVGAIFPPFGSLIGGFAGGVLGAVVGALFGLVIFKCWQHESELDAEMAGGG